MSGHDYERPYTSQDGLALYSATDPETAKKYGKIVKGTPLSNSEYNSRFNRLASENTMRPPPSIGRKSSGYLVVRNLGTANKYETWIPGDAFEDIYNAA